MENADGIEVIKTYERRSAGELNALSKYGQVLVSLRKASADIYFQESGATGVLPFFCLANGKRFVYRIASDAVILGKPLSRNHGFKRKLLDIVEIKRADCVIAQSEFQKKVLNERFKVESVVIKNGLILPSAGYEKGAPVTVLWVGSISEAKSPELFIKLAKSLPKVRFEMVGGRSHPSHLYTEITEAAQELPNLKFHGFVPYHEVDGWFERAALLVNTSNIEGFPNTFIQAWAKYTPVVSLKVDPDNVIEDGKFGFCSGTFEQLVSDVATLLEDEELRKNMGENARLYVEREHDIRKNVEKYIRVFEELS
jgi:glycosyltransferase involved in cell wall biosynthesis